jgi:hypothetical protein
LRLRATHDAAHLLKGSMPSGGTTVRHRGSTGSSTNCQTVSWLVRSVCARNALGSLAPDPLVSAGPRSREDHQRCLTSTAEDLNERPARFG